MLTCGGVGGRAVSSSNLELKQNFIQFVNKTAIDKFGTKTSASWT